MFSDNGRFTYELNLKNNLPAVLKIIIVRVCLCVCVCKGHKFDEGIPSELVHMFVNK